MQFKVRFFEDFKEKSALLHAASENEAKELFAKRHPNATLKSLALKQTAFKLSRVKTKDLALSLNQLGLMLKAGISLENGLNELISSSQNKAVKALFQTLLQGIWQGQSLAASFKNAGYKTSVTAFVEVGEKGGDLAAAFLKLSRVLEEECELKERFYTALCYPLGLLLSLVAAFVVVMRFVVGEFKVLFDSFNAQLPLATRILLAVEEFFSRFGVVLAVAVCVGVALAWVFYAKNLRFKFVLDNIFLKIPLLKELVKEANLSRFFLVCGELVGSGVLLEEALDTAQNALSNEALRQRAGEFKEAVLSGESLSAGLQKSRLASGVTLALINAGEKSGELGGMFLKSAEFYKERLARLTQNLSSAIEPIFLILLGLFVLVLGLGIFLPMWELGGALN